MKNHVELASVFLDALDNLFRVMNAWHLAYTEGVILLKDSPKLLQVLVESRSSGIELRSREKIAG
jgi:hypothetical protein